MMFEVEVKYAVDELESFRAAIADRGGDFDEGTRQVDTYYAHPQRDFVETDEALRVRHAGSTARLTYKGPKIDSVTKTRRELEVPLVDASTHAELLEALGFRPVGTVDKRRRLAHLTRNGCRIEVCLDEVQGLGAFVEMEIQAPQEELEKARETLLSLAAELGLSQVERRGYLDLLRVK